MCFSPEISYGLGALLLAGGGAALYKAVKTDRRYIPMALMPVFVGVQQVAEGAVWTGLGGGCETATQAGSLLFLFFAWVVWPVWIPFMTLCVEYDKNHRKILLAMVAAGAIWGSAMYLPYLWNPEWVSAEIDRHSIAYFHYLWPEKFIPSEVLYAAYLTIIGVSPVLSSHIHLKLFGLFMVVATHIVYSFYVYASTSVLCFFAGIMTTLLIGIVWLDKCRLKKAR